MSLLEMSPSRALSAFVKLCEPHVDDTWEIRRIATQTIEHLQGSSDARSATSEAQALEKRWYRSLERREPDYSVYAAPEYLGELWACWSVYSRQYLRSIAKSDSLGRGSSVLEDIGEVPCVVDLGCGFGFTTAALRELWPDARIFGTNFPGIIQTEIAKRMGERFNFEVVDDVSAIPFNADVVFASEYFEHIYEPIAHLDHVWREVKPTVMLTANAFGARSIGHFVEYLVDDELVHGSEMPKRFGAAMRERGFRARKTRMWNNRPAYWVMEQ